MKRFPKNLHKQIVVCFESIEGWSPAIDRSRKISNNYAQKITFNLWQIKLQLFLK